MRNEQNKLLDIYFIKTMENKNLDPTPFVYTGWGQPQELFFSSGLPCFVFVLSSFYRQL